MKAITTTQFSYGRLSSRPRCSGVLAVAAFSMFLTACGGGGGSASAASGTTTTTATTTTTSLAAGTNAVQLVVTDYKNSTSTITGMPGVASCSDSTSIGTTCNSSGVATGSNVTLTANPAAGYGVVWGGSCSGTAITCSLTMSSNQSVTARFDPQGSDIWWVSTTGNDSNNGRTPTTAFATFHKALTSMSGGDTLYIDDGTYTQSIGGYGGAYSVWDTTPCSGGATGTPPCMAVTSTSRNEGVNGIDSSHRTKILGYRRHKVIVNPSTLSAGKRIGLQLFKGQHIEVGNIVFMHTPDGGPVGIEQMNDVYIHQVGAAYPDSTNSSDNNKATFYVGDSTGVVIEESWGWGYGGRYGIVFHGGTNNVARRNVLRYDGALDGNPKAGISLYSENNSIAENNIVVDFDIGTDSMSDVHAPLFTTSSVPLSSPSLVGGLGSVSWYGNIALNVQNPASSTAQAYLFFDSLTSVGGTITAVNNVVGGVGAGTGNWVAGLWASNDTGTQHGIVLKHNTVYNSNGRGIRVDAPPAWSAVTFNDNLVDLATVSCFNDTSGAGTRINATHNQVFGCTTLAVPNDSSLVTTDPSLMYLLRIDGGGGKGTASDGGDRGATVVKRYNNGTLTSTDLWPFPNEDIIQSDMCAGPDNTSLTYGAIPGTGINTRHHNQSGWCASGKTLTKYIWELLGNTSPY